MNHDIHPDERTLSKEEKEQVPFIPLFLHENSDWLWLVTGTATIALSVGILAGLWMFPHEAMQVPVTCDYTDNCTSAFRPVPQNLPWVLLILNVIGLAFTWYVKGYELDMSQFNVSQVGERGRQLTLGD